MTTTPEVKPLVPPEQMGWTVIPAPVQPFLTWRQLCRFLRRDSKTVAKWRREGPAFPRGVFIDGTEQFRAIDVGVWLASLVSLEYAE